MENSIKEMSGLGFKRCFDLRNLLNKHEIENNNTVGLSGSCVAPYFIASLSGPTSNVIFKETRRISSTMHCRDEYIKELNLNSYDKGHRLSSLLYLRLKYLIAARGKNAEKLHRSRVAGRNSQNRE